MGFVPLDDMEKITRNRYETFLMASQRARQLNAIRLTKLSMLNKDNVDQIEIDGRKVTAVALEDCLQGKVKYKVEQDGEEPTDS